MFARVVTDNENSDYMEVKIANRNSIFHRLTILKEHVMEAHKRR